MTDASSRALSILVATWNVGNKRPEEAELEHWLPAKGGSHDVIAIGTQENSFRNHTKRKGSVAEDADEDEEDDEDDEEASMTKIQFAERKNPPRRYSGNRRSIFGGSSSKQHAWDAMCAERLGSGWVAVAHVVLREMRLTVYVTRELERSSVKHVATAYAATGLKGLYGNKGGLVARLVCPQDPNPALPRALPDSRPHARVPLAGQTIGHTSLAFCSCHLAAHEGHAHFSQRNAMCRKVLLKTMGRSIGGMREKAWRFGKAGRPLDIAHAVDHLFWLGDLNYRVQARAADSLALSRCLTLRSLPLSRARSLTRTLSHPRTHTLRRPRAAGDGLPRRELKSRECPRRSRQRGAGNGGC